MNRQYHWHCSCCWGDVVHADIVAVAVNVVDGFWDDFDEVFVLDVDGVDILLDDVGAVFVVAINFVGGFWDDVDRVFRVDVDILLDYIDAAFVFDVDVNIVDVFFVVDAVFVDVDGDVNVVGIFFHVIDAVDVIIIVVATVSD